MAFTKITQSATATRAPNLINLVNNIRTALNQANLELSIMANRNDNASMEAMYGLPAGSAAGVFDLVNGLAGALNGTFQNNNAKTITEVLG